MDPGARRHADTSTSRPGFSHTASVAGGTRTPEEARGEPGQAAASRHAGPVVIVSQGDSLDPHLGRTTASAGWALFGWTTPRTNLQLASQRRPLEPWTGRGWRRRQATIQASGTYLDVAVVWRSVCLKGVGISASAGLV